MFKNGTNLNRMENRAVKRNFYHIYQNSNTVYTTDVVIEDQEFAESKGSSSSDGGSYQPAGRPSPANAKIGRAHV